MNTENKRSAMALIKAVAAFQIKLLLDAGRDLLLSPIALAGALIDLLLIKWSEPTFFRAVMRLGEHSDRWIDVWADPTTPPPRENVDALIARVEEVLRDPQTGARRARVLRRWAERQVARARQRAAAELSARLPANTGRGDTPSSRSDS